MSKRNKMIYKYKFITLIYVLLLLVFAGAFTTQAFANVYQDISYRYSIEYPSDWFFEANLFISGGSFKPKLDYCKCTFLTVDALPLQSYNTLEDLKNIWTGPLSTAAFGSVKNAIPTTFAAMPAYKIVYNYNNGEHEMISWIWRAFRWT